MHLLSTPTILALALITSSYAQFTNTTPPCPGGYSTIGNLSCAYVTTVSASLYIGGVPSDSSTLDTVIYTDGRPATLATIETSLGLAMPFFYTTLSLPAPTNTISGTLTCPSGFGTLNGGACVATAAVATLPGSSTVMTTVTPSMTVAPGSGGMVTSAAVASQLPDGQVQATSAPAVAPYKGAASSYRMQAGGIIGLLVGAFAVGLGLAL